MWPTRRFPFSAIATMEGVVLYPPRFGMTTGVPSSTTATQLLVVPRSIPMTFSAIVPLHHSTQLRGDVWIFGIEAARLLERPPRLGKPAGRAENFAQGAMRRCILRIKLHDL